MENKKFTNEIVRDHNSQLYVQLSPEEGESIPGFCIRLSTHLNSKNYNIIKVTCFGSITYRETFEKELKSHASGRFPITWIEGENCTDAFMNGIQVWALESEVKYLETDFDALASFFEDENARYLYMGQIFSDPAKHAGIGYTKLLKDVDRFLGKHGFTFKDIVRTWYYLDNILIWYDEFNQLRSDYFQKSSVFENLIPASTAVSGRNQKGSSVTMELFAVLPKNNSISIEKLSSPLQNEANDYGSAFSRAVKVNSNGSQWTSISGTASILQSGETVYEGDSVKQIQFSFSVIEELLKREGYGFNDIVRSTAYLKNTSIYPVLQSFFKQFPEYQIPLIITENTVCRDNLLFEIEMDLLI